MTALLILAAMSGCALSIILSRIHYKKKLERGQYGLLVLWSLLAVILPAAGFLYGWLMVRKFRDRTDDSFISDYSDYIHNKVYNFENLHASLAQDRSLLTAGSSSPGNPGVMKNLLLSMSNEETLNQERLIKKGLNHPDTEAVHYAATITNVLQDRLSERIRRLQMEKKQGHPEIYLQLKDTYEELLSSELLSSSSREKAEEDYEAFLREAADYYIENPVYLEALGLFLLRKNSGEGESILQRLLTQHSNSSRVLWGWLQISYKYDRWQTVYELAGRLKDHEDFPSFPEKQKEIIHYLGGTRK